MLKNILQGLRSLFLHKLRTFLSTLGVVFGVTAVVAMLSIGEGAKKETLEQINQLGINTITLKQNEMSEEQFIRAFYMRSLGLTEQDLPRFRDNVPFLERMTALKIVESSINATHVTITPEILAITPTYNKIKGLEIEEGRFICPLDLQQKKNVCVLGYQVAKTLGINGHVGQIIRMESVPFEIVGVLKNKSWTEGKVSALSSRDNNLAVFIPLGSEFSINLSNIHPKNRSLSEVILQIDHQDHLTKALQVTKRLLERKETKSMDYQIVVPQELIKQAKRTQYTFNLILGSIAAISLLVGGIGIMNIMLATISERTHEIGIRRALGASRMHIALQFVTESLLLTGIGAVIGVLMGVTFSYLISYIAGWVTVVTYWSLMLSLAMAGIVGMLSGLYPSLKAAFMNPITALNQR